MPHAIKMQEEFGKDGFVSVLMESQGLPADELLGFMMQRFPKNRCVVTPGQGLSTDPSSGGLPNAALVGADGTVLFAGNPNGAPKKIEGLVEEELKKIKAGWGKSPEVKKARSLMYSKGQLGEADKVLKAAESTVKDDAKEDLEEAKAELTVRYASRKKSVTAMMEQGRFVEANKNALQLQKDVKGAAEWETEVNALVEAFKTPENDKELKADQALAKLVAGLGDKSPKAEQGNPFKAFAKKNEGTKAAARAEAYAAGCAYKPK